MCQLCRGGDAEVPITTRHVFFDTNTKKLVEIEFSKLSPYERAKWDQLGIDTELYGRSKILERE
jgi:hypothetical protein